VNRAKQNEAKNKTAQAENKKIAQLETEERLLLRQLEYFDIVCEKATNNFQPNELASYLLDLAKAFNSFYKEQFRLLLIKRAGEIIKLGLYLLGIDTVERM
jgi:arginyl-tRNA synthetase